MSPSRPDDENFEVVDPRSKSKQKARPITDPDTARRKKRKKEADWNPMTLIILGASVGGLVAVTAVIIGVVIYMGGRKTPPVATAPAPAPVAAAPVALEPPPPPEAPKGPKIPTWVWFEIPDTKNFAAFPNRKPDKIPSPLDSREDGKENGLGLGLIESTRWGLTDDGRNYTLTILKLPSELAILGMTSEALLETVMADRSKVLITEGGKVQSTTAGNLRGVQYHHLEVSKTTGTALIRVYALGTTLYALKVDAKELTKDDPIALDFLCSFRQPGSK